MRKIVSKHEREKKARRNQLILGLVLASVMIFSVVGYAFQANPRTDGEINPENKVTYNGVEFSLINGFWVAGGFAFSYNPNEIQNFLSEAGNDLKDATVYQGLPLYIYSESADAGTELKANLGLLSTGISDVCVEGTECLSDLPLKKCDAGENVLVIKENSVRDIRQENGCVFIEGPSQDLLAMTDSFLFKILGVTP